MTRKIQKSNFFDQFYELINNKAKDIDTQKLIDLAELIKAIKLNSGKVIIVGNGGSAAISSHVSIDLTKAANIRSINFNEASLLTCFSNDYTYEKWVEKAIDFFEKTDIGSGEWRVLETPFIQTQLKKLGFSGYKTSEPGTVGLFNSDKGDVRSLYAKFDPKQEKSGEILASIVPYASVGTIGALAGLDEGT